jgi:hypothetical protein
VDPTQKRQGWETINEEDRGDPWNGGYGESEGRVQPRAFVAPSATLITPAI